MNDQATLPTFEPAQFVRPYTKPLDSGSPEVNDYADTNAHDIYNVESEPICRKIVIQNLGIGTVKICLNNTASASVFHNVLAAGVATDDGLGSVQEYDLTQVDVNRISVIGSVNPTRVSVVKYIDENQVGGTFPHE